MLVYDAWVTGDGASDMIDDLRDLHPTSRRRDLAGDDDELGRIGRAAPGHAGGLVYARRPGRRHRRRHPAGRGPATRRCRGRIEGSEASSNVRSALVEPLTRQESAA
jgi:hypothetical protein